MNYLILVGSNKKTGNGKRFVLYTDNPEYRTNLMNTVEELSRYPFIRINAGQKWKCPSCGQVNLTKANAVQCSYCDRRTRVLVENKAIPKNVSVSLAADIEQSLKDSGYCKDCFRKLSECECRS